MAPRKNPAVEADCPSNATCAAQFATIIAGLANIVEKMEELKKFVKEENADLVQKKFDDLENRIKELERFRNDILKKIAYVMGAFAVIFFLLQIAVQFALKHWGG
jgi:uncharacterized membrane protein